MKTINSVNLSVNKNCLKKCFYIYASICKELQRGTEKRNISFRVVREGLLFFYVFSRSRVFRMFLVFVMVWRFSGLTFLFVFALFGYMALALGP